MSLQTCAARAPTSQAAALPSCSTLTGTELPRAKEVLCLCTQGRFGSVRLTVTLWTVARQASLSLRGVLQARILERIGQYWWPYPSRALFPAALASKSPEYLVLPVPLQPKQLHHLHTWPSLGQTQVLQGRLRSKPPWMAHIQRWK